MATPPDTNSVITPIVHMNGDSYHTLIRNLEQAYNAVDKAIDALANVSPNGRNYYLAPGRLEKAQQQQHERLTALQTVLLSLEREAAQLDDETLPSLKRP